MAVKIYDILEKSFVGAGLADGADLFNIVTNVEWSEDTQVLVVNSKDGEGNAATLRIDLSSIGAGGAGGVSESDVRALIGQVVEAWAVQGDSTAIPSSKLPSASTSAAGAVQLATDAEATAGTLETKAITPKQLKDNSGGSIADWAEDGNTDKVPEAKLPVSSPILKGIIETADQNDADTGTNTLNAMTPALVKRRIDAGTTGEVIKGKLEGLSGNARLDASAVKNLPSAQGGSESGASIKTKLEGLSGNSRLDVSAVKGSLTTAQLNSLDHTVEVSALPTVGLGSTYPTGSIVRFKENWMELVANSDSAEHGIKITSGRDGNSVGYNNVDSTRQKFGSVAREGGQTILADPIGGFFFNVSNGQVTLFLETNRTTSIYFRAYTGAPANDNEIDTGELRRSAAGDVTVDGINYKKFVSSANAWDGDNPASFYVRFFTASPATSNQTANGLTVFSNYEWHAIDVPPEPPVHHTPRRVDAIPADFPIGDKVYLKTQEFLTGGVEITPISFDGTELDGKGWGDRGFYRKPDAPFSYGDVTPDISSNIILVSNTRVAVKRGTMTDLTHLLLKTVRYPLVRVPLPANSKILTAPEYAATQPEVDYYTITGGLPVGDWDGLRFLRSNNTYSPRRPLRPPGNYYSDGTDPQLDDYDAKPADTMHELKFMVEEKINGASASKSLTFVAEGSNFAVNNPFPNVLKLTYHNDSTETDLYRRWSLQVPLANYVDSRAPIRLEARSKFFPLAYLETGTGHATYISNETSDVTQRVAAAGRQSGFNIQFRNQEWASSTGGKKLRRTITSDQLAKIARKAHPTYVLPPHPVSGELIRVLTDVTWDGGSVIYVAEGDSNFIGVRANVGEFKRETTGIAEVGAYIGGSSVVANKVAVKRASGNTKTPSRVDISDGFVEHSFTLVSAGSDYWYANNLAVDTADEVRKFFVPGRRYRFQVTYGDGTKEYSSTTFMAGDEVIWADVTWVRVNFSEADINSIVDTNLSQKNIKSMWFGTTAQYNAITTKDPNVLYFTR